MLSDGVIVLSVIFGFSVVMAEETSNFKKEAEQHATLFDFRTVDNLTDWEEVSDTVREVGTSKATFVLQKTKKLQRAILFTLLNPQPNGACFAGIKTGTMFDLSDYESITVNLRGQGANSQYKVVMQHKSRNNTSPTYEQIFEVPMGEFYTIRVPLDKFQPYFRGKLLNDTEPLDKSHITSIGIQVFGGVYIDSLEQSGVSSLEIDWIRADI